MCVSVYTKYTAQRKGCPSARSIGSIPNTYSRRFRAKDYIQIKHLWKNRITQPKRQSAPHKSHESDRGAHAHRLHVYVIRITSDLPFACWKGWNDGDVCEREATVGCHTNGRRVCRVKRHLARSIHACNPHIGRKIVRRCREWICLRTRSDKCANHPLSRRLEDYYICCIS